MRDCREIRDLLPLWAGDDLPSDEAAVVEEHLAACGECRAAAESWRDDLVAMRADLAGDVAPALSQGRLDSAVAAADSRRPRRRLPRRRAFWAAAAPLAAMLAVVLLWRPPADDLAPGAVTFPQLQQTFAGCLEEPVPLEEWEGERRAGVVTVLAAAEDGSGYVVADCLEMADLSRLRAYPWAEQRVADWRQRVGDRLLVTVCPTDEGGRTARRRLRRDVLALRETGG